MDLILRMRNQETLLFHALHPVDGDPCQHMSCCSLHWTKEAGPRHLPFAYYIGTLLKLQCIINVSPVPRGEEFRS